MKTKNFEQFINERHSYSNSVDEYAKLCKSLINDHFKRYLNFDFKKGTFTNFSTPIIITDAQSEVSQATSGDFPINQIKIDFKITVSKEWNSMVYQGHYQRAYDKVKVLKGKDEKINIEILCGIIISRNEMILSVEKANEFIDDILAHELTHAYNDYKKPAGFHSALPHLQAKLTEYDFSKVSATLNNFMFLLYALSDQEIYALAGERKSFQYKRKFNDFSGTHYARQGKRYNADEYYDRIVSELTKYHAVEYVIGNFGELFIKEYKKIAKDLGLAANPKILKLKKTATLKQVLHFFEKYINLQGDKLFRKLSKKIEPRPMNTTEGPDI